jgi:hypothetical protein
MTMLSPDPPSRTSSPRPPISTAAHCQIVVAAAKENVASDPHVIRAGDDANRWRWAGVPVRAGRSGWTGGASRPCSPTSPRRGGAPTFSTVADCAAHRIVHSGLSPC